MKLHLVPCQVFATMVCIGVLAGGHFVRLNQAHGADFGPRPPHEELALFHLADPELLIELVAAEPMVESPVALAWDTAGRMYVVQMSDYPVGPPGGSLVRLEDRDRDGSYEHAQVFAAGLSFPAGVLPTERGVLVAAAPDILLLVDEDGDGTAEGRRVLFSGFAEGNQQLRANGLLWGLDNWIYGANGRSDGEVRLAEGLSISLRGRDFRFTPDFARFDALPGQSQFGNARDDWGNRFLSWNTVVIRQAMFDDAALSGNPRLAGRAVHDLADPADGGQVYPRSPRPVTFNAERTDFYNALAGLTVYRGHALGPSYQGNVFVGESLSNLIHRRVLEPDGPTFVSRRGEAEGEFLAGEDPWFHPVFLATGPDGCLYVADFYRRWVEHPQFVADAAKRAEVDWREGAGHGRIWRIRRRDFVVSPPEPLDQASTEKLVAVLADRNGWIRDTAQRLLVERRDAAAWPALRGMLGSPAPALARLHALYVLDGTQALQAADVMAALADEHPQLRRHALRLASRLIEHGQPPAGNPVERSAAAVEELRQAVRTRVRIEQHPLVRFELALALRAFPPAERLESLRRIIAASADEPWTLAAASSSAGELAWPLLDDLLREAPAWLEAPSSAQLAFLHDLGVLAGRPTNLSQQREQLARLADGQACKAARAAIFAGLLEAWEEAGQRLRGGDASDLLSSPALEALCSLAVALAIDPDAPSEARVLAVKAAGAAATAEALARLSSLLLPGQPDILQAEAAGALCAADDNTLATTLFDGWQQWGMAARAALPAAALRSHTARQALLAALEAERLLPQELDANLRQALLRSLDPADARRAAAILTPASPADRLAVLAEYQQSLQLPADARRGAELFREHCLTCHAVRGRGRRVGPDLSSVANRDKEKLLVDVLDPSREVAPNYLAYTLVTDDGRIYTGLLAAETSTTLTLRRSEGAEDTIARQQIESLTASGKSFMPEGLEQKVTPAQLADLLEFLTRPDPSLLVP
ncbi:MAG: c-type cytochrome [Pirellulales bacterium]|nr:c-type cytochrome [Pirellulales bacterium]